MSLPARDDFDDFETVAGVELAVGEFGGGNGLAVVLYHDAAGRESEVQKEILYGTGIRSLDFFPVCENKGGGGCGHK